MRRIKEALLGSKGTASAAEADKKGETVTIGHLDVPLAQVESARDSAALARDGKMDEVAARLREDGYVAFSSFFAEETVSKVRSHLPRMDTGYEVNLGNLDGQDNAAQWRRAGCIADLNLAEKAAFQTLVENVMRAAGFLVPGRISVHLAWLRGKAASDSSPIQCVFEVF